MMIFQEGDRKQTQMPDKNQYNATTTVTPKMEYAIKFEILLNDLGHPHEKVSKLELNGKNVGGCNPDCPPVTAGECDHLCTFYDCTSQLTTTSVSSDSEILDMKLEIQGNSRDCDCNKTTWECKQQNQDPTLAPMEAVAKITLTPISKYFD